MAVYSPVIPPSSLGDALRPLGDLSAAEFDAVATAVSGPRSFFLRREDFEKLRNQISTHALNVAVFLSALNFLYSHVTRLLESSVPYNDIIEAMTDELDKEAQWGTKKDEVKTRLATVLKKREVHQRFRKIQRLQSGFIPNAVRFSSFVDLRPDFGDEDQMKIMGYLPVIQFRVSTDASNPEAKRIVFQMSEETIADLRKAIDRAEKKLQALKEQPAVALQLIKV
jgi:hypothetical protein